MSVFTRDANGYPTQLCSPALETRPTTGPSRAPLKASGLHHLSYQCLDYKKARDFYVELLGARVTNDTGSQAQLWFGDAFVLVQNSTTAITRPVIDHVAWTVSNWNKDRVIAVLQERGLHGQVDASGASIMTKDLNGYPLELCSKDFKAAAF